MKTKITSVIIFCLTAMCVYGQNDDSLRTNNILRGKILYLSSGKTPAIGVSIEGKIPNSNYANKTFTVDDGSFDLKFPYKKDGYKVDLEVGDTDTNKNEIEVVNITEVENCYMRAQVSDEFEIIVCPKGARDLAAQKYYNIIKTSSDIALEEKKKELDNLLAAQKKDYNKITALSEKISRLEKQTDSLAIYRTAWRIASVNKDNANERVLKYIDALDKGKTIQEALNILSIELATKQIDNGIKITNEGFEELEFCAEGSMGIFDYNSAIACYDIIILKMEEMDKNPLAIAEYCEYAIEAALDGGKYEKALKYANKSIRTREAILEHLHPDLATSYNQIGRTYRLLGNYKKALELHQKSTEIREAIFDPKHRSLVQSYNNVASTYYSLGQYGKALEFQKKTIEIQEEILNPKHPNLANAYSNIAAIYHSLGQYKKTLELQQKAINILEEILDPKHPNLAAAYNNIAGTYEALTQYEKALEFHKKNVEIKEAILDSKHPNLASSYSNIALTYQSLAQYEKALTFHKKAIEIQEEIFDPKHPDLATTNNNIAITYQSLGRYEKALVFQKKALEINEKILGPKHFDLATNYNNIAITYQYLQQYNRALDMQKNAINILEEILDPQHPFLAKFYINIGGTYGSLEQFEKALELQQKALEIWKAIKHPDLAVSYIHIGKTYESIGQHEKALDFLQKSIEIWEEILDPKHPYLAAAYSNIGITYLSLKQYEKAFEFQKKAFSILKDTLPKDHPDQQKVFNRLINIYLKKKDFTIALADLKALNEQKESSSNWNYIGLCHYHLKDYAKAIESYQKAASLDSLIKTKDFYNNIGTTYAKNKQFKEAFEAFTEYEKLFPKEGRPFRNWAMYYALLNDTNQAITHLQKAIDLGFDDLEWLKTDDSMDGLRKEPAFMALVEQLEKLNNENQKSE